VVINETLELSIENCTEVKVNLIIQGVLDVVTSTVTEIFTMCKIEVS